MFDATPFARTTGARRLAPPVRKSKTVDTVRFARSAGNRCGNRAGCGDERGCDGGHNAAALEAGTQDALGALQSAAERAGVAAQFAGGFLLRAALEEAEHHGIAQAIRQPGELLVEDAELVGESTGWSASSAGRVTAAAVSWCERRAVVRRICRATRPATPMSQPPTEPAARAASIRVARTRKVAWKASSAALGPTSRRQMR